VAPIVTAARALQLGLILGTTREAFGKEGQR
jgi:hypothetical protein